ncbi:RNA-binding protein 28 [Spodoptera litura]|uniref:RNA-binding protein 28 n=1 Tax=Spodoptera litura TaxID=69820 RepID=A0A9J7E3H4_SPOLT|nr:RNA-binding protein 28 [Spodoptera litura]XP_022823411.1 RNA-binding protein 28 [Spodoptera litura]
MDDEFYSGVNDVKSNKESTERNGRIIVRNISFKATKEALKEHFGKYGTVQEVNLLKKPDGKLVGCGFVHFADVAQAEKAIASTNKKPFLDRPIHVAFAVSKKAYVQNMENNSAKQRFNSNSDDDNKLFSEVKEETNKSTEEKQKKERINRNARLVVRNVSFKATEETLKEHFTPYGDILEVKLLKKPDGKLVGCAFVHFKNVPMAKKALLNTNMKPFLGRPISVDWAVAKNKYMQHVVSQQLEMEEKVKKEESDSDDDDNKPPLNVTADDIKDEIKSESESEPNSNEEEDSDSDDDDKAGVKGESDDDDDEDDDSEEQDDDDEEEDDEEDEGDKESEAGFKQEHQRIKLNDAEDGCTVFITNIPFSVDNDQLRQFAENIGPVKYALICVDKMTEHSKGTGFVKFADKEHADAFLSLPADQLRLEGQTLSVKPALKRENLQKGNKKEAKDNRNLYLVKEGVVVAGTKAAVGVSASDMAKRLALERSKTQMLKNLNRFVSRYRLVVSNLPAHYDDAKLRKLCVGAGDRRAVVTECRVMRDLRTPPGPDGKNPSKGYGFVMFTRHEDALACLRKLNNNPDVFDKNNRPIVSFSIEDRTALNARKKRLEKSIANNPLANKDGGQTTDRRNRKRKPEIAPDESYAKRRKFGKLNKFNKNSNQGNDNRNQSSENQGSSNLNFNRNNNEKQNKFNKKGPRQNNGSGQFVKKPRYSDFGEYTGLTAKEGSQHKMRSNHKLKAQAEIHRQTVKTEKKQSKRAQRLKMAAKERIKLPKQKINKNPNKKRKKHHNQSKFDRFL